MDFNFTPTEERQACRMARRYLARLRANDGKAAYFAPDTPANVAGLAEFMAKEVFEGRQAESWLDDK